MTMYSSSTLVFFIDWGEIFCARIIIMRSYDNPSRLLFFGVLAGLLIAINLFAVSLVLKKRNSPKQSKNNDYSVIAPYYEEKVFHRPGGLKNTNSSKLSKIKLPIIMYHYVEYVQDQADFIRKSLDINPEAFARQLTTLKYEGYQTYFVKDIPDILDGKITVSSKSAVLTFDDGYEDFYTVAFPILKKNYIRATVFIVNDFIGRKGFLTKDQVKEIIDSDLVEIGAHTLDHAYLKNMSPTAAKRQIFESKRQLEESFGINVKTFAYPYGAFDEKTIDLVKEASYSAAVSVINGVIQSQENLFYLSRLRSGFFTPANIVAGFEHFNK